MKAAAQHERAGGAGLPPGNRGPDTCLLCGNARLEVTQSYPAEAIRKSWTIFGVTFTPDTWKAFNGLSSVNLFRCATCGFQFCDPKLAGDGAFYAELERQRKSYYAPDVPEFHRTIAWARQRNLRTVLDVGCGEGAFLDLARQSGLDGTGLELNVQAAEFCRQKGYTIHTRPLSELIAEKGGPRFDLVTLFQVLEHVPDPVHFLSEAAALLAPNGCLSVAVPNASGIYRICPKEPHQWPPHHVTRWRRHDLRHLGNRCGLEVLAVGANRLLGQEAEHFWNVQNQLAAFLGEGPLPGGKWLPYFASRVYRTLGLQHVMPGLGTNVYALYRRAA